MIEAKQLTELPSPLNIGINDVIVSVDELVRVLIDDVQASLEKLPLVDDEERMDFILACDALNIWRLNYRLREEYHKSLVAPIQERVIDCVCAVRGYDRNEFLLAMEATESHRFPFGLDPLRFAVLRAKTDPIVILREDLTESLVQEIFAVAIHLQILNRQRPILLPIEQLRLIFRCRKLLVAGAVKKLTKLNMITEVGPKAHTGRAREFRVLAKEGVDYLMKEKGSRDEP